MLQESSSLLLDQLRNHVAEHGANSIESFIGGAYIIKTMIVEEDLLDNENGHRLAQLGARLHDAQTQRNDLRRQKKINDIGRIVLHQGPNDTQRRQPQVLKGARLGGCVEKGIEK